VAGSVWPNYPISDYTGANGKLNTAPLMATHTALGLLVAVGTTIADRPPHRSVRAPLRIRLLLWMSGGKARIRIRMQNFARVAAASGPQRS
jgi:hypothetical protein